MTHKYDIKFKLDEPNSYCKIDKRIAKGSLVLDVGPGVGYFAEHLKHNKNCRVEGIEYDPELVKILNQKLDKIYYQNLNNIQEWINLIPEDCYDYITLMNVLEHVYDPFKVLNFLRTKLKKTGKFLVAIPNVAHASLLIELLTNSFTYTDIGLLDSTHLRWYTPYSFKYMLDVFKFNLTYYDSTYMVPSYSELGKDYDCLEPIAREAVINKTDSHTFEGIYEFYPSENQEYFISESLFDIFPTYNGTYDSITVFDKDKKIFQHHCHNFNEEVEFTLPENLSYITIRPSIRYRVYKIRIYHNDQEIYISPNNLSDNNIIKESSKFVSLGNQTIKLSNNFNKNDRIKINVVYDKESALKKLEKGKISMSNELNILKSKIEKYSIVSFDIFDTLLLRNVLYPTDIFRVIEEKYGYKNYFKLRTESESKARTSKNNYECSYEEIYQQLSNFYSKDEINTLQNLEMEIEREFLIANPFMKKLYDYALEIGKKVVIISDMYLPRDFIEEVLKNNGYDNYSELIISNQIKKSKHNGDIYSYLIQKGVLEPKKTIHIGDNKNSDYLNPINYGLSAHHYEPVRTRAKIASQFDYSVDLSIMTAISINKVHNGLEINYWHKFGAKVAAPLYYGLTKWVADLNRGKDNLFFLGRDGYIVKKVYDKFCKLDPDLPESSYLKTSRVAYQIPNLVNEHINIAVDVLTQRNVVLGHELTLRDIFNFIGLNFDDKIILKKFGFSSLDVLVDDSTLHDSRKLVAYLYPKIKKVLLEKYYLVLKYMRQEGLFNYDTINIFDIGWRGSIQYSIQKMTGKNVVGYYLGTFESTYPEIMSTSFGYLVDLGVQWYDKVWVEEAHMLFEFLFSSPEGSLLGFQEQPDGTVIPIEEEDSDNTNSDKVKIFQLSALDAVDEYIKYSKYLDNVSKYDATSNFRSFMDSKVYEDLVEFSQVFSNIGYENKKYKYVEKYKKEYILKHKEEFLEKIKKSLWRNAFLVEEITNEDDYYAFRREQLLEPEILKKHNRPSLFSLENLRKAIRNPRKAISVLKLKLRARYIELLNRFKNRN